MTENPNIKTLGNYILLKRYVKPQKKSVILLNNEETSKHLGITQETIVDGESGDFIIHCGDLVQYRAYSQIPVEGHEEYVFVKEEDIIAILPFPVIEEPSKEPVKVGVSNEV